MEDLLTVMNLRGHSLISILTNQSQTAPLLVGGGAHQLQMEKIKMTHSTSNTPKWHSVGSQTRNDESGLTIQYEAWFNPVYGYCITSRSTSIGTNEVDILNPESLYLNPINNRLFSVYTESGLIHDAEMNTQIADLIVDIYEHWSVNSSGCADTVKTGSSHRTPAEICQDWLAHHAA